MYLGRIFLIISATLFFQSGVSFARPLPEPTSLALVGGRLIDGYGGSPLENSVILVSGDSITAIGRVGQLPVPPEARIIDTNGMTVLPGLWESHGHLFHIGEADPNRFQKRFNHQIPEIMASVAKITLSAGVTAVREFCTTCSATSEGWRSPLFEQQRELRGKINRSELPGPRLYFSGPILSQATHSTRRDNSFQVGTVAEAREATEQLIAMGVDNIFAGAEQWEPDLLKAITEAAHAVNMGVDAEARDIKTLKTVLEAGVDRVHVFFTADALANYSDTELRLLVRGLNPIASGPSANILRGPWVLSTLAMRQTYVDVLGFPELLDHPRFQSIFSLEIYRDLRNGWRNPQQIPWGIGAIQRVETVKKKLKRFIEAGGREQLVAATDAGAPLNFHSPIPKQLRYLVEAGLTPMEAIQSATLRPAQMQGVFDRLGTVSIGKIADLIVVDGDPLQEIEVLQYGVVHVIRGGEVFK